LEQSSCRRRPVRVEVDDVVPAAPVGDVVSVAGFDYIHARAAGEMSSP